MISSKLLSCFSLLLLFISAQAQTNQVDSTGFDEVKSLVRFYEYMLNTVGDRSTPTREKEIIINESYKKVFSGPTVQIEDDLAPDRQVITNKDVNSYLRDVDFFFKDISFDFSDVQIVKDKRPQGLPYYLVSFNSTIDAVSLSSEIYRSSNRRFLEVNVDTSRSELKIVSVYTTKISRTAELRNWWEQLSYGWVRVFQSIVPFESMTDAVLLQIGNIDSINIEGNQFIQDIQPLEALRELRYVNISGTKVTDLSPLRYCKNLIFLEASNTNITDVKMLSYLDQLEVLDLSRTPLQDLIGIEHLGKLKSLNLSGSDVLNFGALKEQNSIDSLNLSNTTFADSRLISQCHQLRYLRLDRTGVVQITSLNSLKQLRYLDISETNVVDLAALKDHPALQTIRLNQTSIESLVPLKNAPKLSRIYADYSGISEKKAAEFMQQRPKVAVITNSVHMKEWWNNLSPEWRNIFAERIGRRDPTEEDLVKFLNTDSLDLSNLRLVNGEPLNKFKRLKYLKLTNNLLTDLSFVQEMKELEKLIADGMPITSVEILSHNKALTYVNLSRTQISDVTVFLLLNKLDVLEVDGTKVRKEQVKQLLDFNPKMVVVFQSDHLMEWWNSLSRPWRQSFDLLEITPLTLHQLVEQTQLNITDEPVVSLSVLNEFINLKEITLNNTGVTSFLDLASHDGLQKITCKNGPLMNLEGISHHQNLVELDISNTAVDDLRPLRGINELKILNCSGTNIKKLKGLEELKKLEFVNISNTRVWQLQRLYDIRNLKSLVCYNTRIRDHKIEEFKSVFPDCEITYY